MNQPKFRYDNECLVFFVSYKGTQVELLRIKLETCDLNNIKHYRKLAIEQLNELNALLRHGKAA